MAEETPKITLYSQPDLKNTSDDAVAPYLKSLGYRQIHTLTDVRLVLGFSACVIAAGTFYYDFTQGFEKAKPVTLWAVIAYFILNTFLTLWIWAVEAGVVYVGERDGTTVSIATKTEKFSPFYNVTITTKPKDSPAHTVHVKESFTAWFDERGYFVLKPFQRFLTASIPDVAARNLVIEEKEMRKAGKK